MFRVFKLNSNCEKSKIFLKIEELPSHSHKVLLRMSLQSIARLFVSLILVAYSTMLVNILKHNICLSTIAWFGRVFHG